MMYNWATLLLRPRAKSEKAVSRGQTAGGSDTLFLTPCANESSRFSDASLDGQERYWFCIGETFT